MTKKDFELIASVFYQLNGNNYDKNVIAGRIANTLQSLYPRFKKEKFLKACGVETNTIPECPIDLKASVDAFNAGYGSVVQRTFYCEEAGEWVAQEWGYYNSDTKKEWFCLHSGE